MPYNDRAKKYAATRRWRKRKAYKKTLDYLLKDATERVQNMAVEALNQAADNMVNDIKNQMTKAGIKDDKGTLRESIKTTHAQIGKYSVMISSEAYKPAPKNPGARNPEMKGRYKNGVPYGRILEFSPRYNRPFFYTAWYNQRDAVKQFIIECIGKAWSGN